MFWREARILRLAKASQGCLAFAVVHSPMATESVGGGGRSAASKIAPAISDGFTGSDPRSLRTLALRTLYHRGTSTLRGKNGPM